jgi:hypothetical protein
MPLFVFFLEILLAMPHQQLFISFLVLFVSISESLCIYFGDSFGNFLFLSFSSLYFCFSVSPQTLFLSDSEFVFLSQIGCDSFSSLVSPLGALFPSMPLTPCDSLCLCL